MGHPLFRSEVGSSLGPSHVAPVYSHKSALICLALAMDLGPFPAGQTGKKKNSQRKEDMVSCGWRGFFFREPIFFGFDGKGKKHLIPRLTDFERNTCATGRQNESWAKVPIQIRESTKRIAREAKRISLPKLDLSHFLGSGPVWWTNSSRTCSGQFWREKRYQPLMEGSPRFPRGWGCM